MYRFVWIYVFISLGSIIKDEMAESNSNYVKFLKNNQTLFA